MVTSSSITHGRSPNVVAKAARGRTVVWEHNRLAEARYELSPREQKLVLYVIAMIEPEDADFKRYVVNISAFARLASLSKDDLYRELPGAGGRTQIKSAAYSRSLRC
jgi:Initiator Replication protein